jgi:hypothetical protein
MTDLTPVQIQQARVLAQQWVNDGWANAADAADQWARAVLALTEQQAHLNAVASMTTVPGESSDYRDRILDALRPQLPDFSGISVGFIAGVVLEVRDAEMEQLRTEFAEQREVNEGWAAYGQRVKTQLRKLRAERRAYSELLRGMARRVAKYRQAANAEAAIVDEEQAEGNRLRAELADLRSRAVILPEPAVPLEFTIDRESLSLRCRRCPYVCSLFTTDVAEILAVLRRHECPEPAKAEDVIDLGYMSLAPEIADEIERGDGA